MAWTLVTPADLVAFKERSGLSWIEIGHRLGVTHGAVYCWRVGRTVAPLETQAKMAALFGLTKPVDPPTVPEAAPESELDDLILEAVATTCLLLRPVSAWVEQCLKGEGPA